MYTKYINKFIYVFSVKKNLACINATMKNKLFYYLQIIKRIYKKCSIAFLRTFTLYFTSTTSNLFYFDFYSFYNKSKIIRAFQIPYPELKQFIGCYYPEKG